MDPAGVEVFIELDVGKSEHHATVLDADGQIVAARTVRNEQAPRGPSSTQRPRWARRPVVAHLARLARGADVGGPASNTRWRWPTSRASDAPRRRASTRRGQDSTLTSRCGRTKGRTQSVATRQHRYAALQC